MKVKAAVIPQAAKTADNTGIPTDETPPSVVFQTVTAPGTWLKSQQPYTSETPCKIILTARDKAIPKFIRVVRKLQFLNNFLMSLRGAELRGIFNGELHSSGGSFERKFIISSGLIPTFRMF